MAKKPSKQPAQNKAAAKPVAQPAAPKKEKNIKDWFSVNRLCIVLAVISILLYANTLQGGYVMDDVMVLKDNRIVMKGLKAIPELLATPHMRGYLVIPNDLYRPLSLVMFAIEYQFFGPSPAAGHFFNILVFMGCVVMLFLFFNKFFDGKKTAIAFIVALLFAIHPIHTEVVANIKSRDELLCFFFAFLSLNLFMNYMKNGKMVQLALGVFCLFLSYISKETVITFIPIIPLLFFFYSKESRSRAVYITAGMIVATVAFLLIRMVVLNEYNANQPGATVDFMDNALAKVPGGASKIATELLVIGMYLKLMFLPYPLLCNYSYNTIPFVGFGNIWVLLSIVAYGFLFYVAITRFLKDKKDPWAFAIVFFIVTLSLFSNFPFLMGAELAERFAFFASTGFCLAGALAIEKWIIKGDAGDTLVLKSTKVLAVLVPLILVFGGMTVARNASWKDEFTLYKTDRDKCPENSRLNQYLATALGETVYFEETDTTKQKQIDDEAIGYLKHALEIYPDFAEAHVELGRIYDRKHMFDSAEIHDLRALALNPISSTANNNIGSVYISTGRYREAIGYLLKSVAINPNFKFVYLNLANCYMQVKQYDSAITNYKMMLAFDPNYVDAYQKIGLMYFQKQSYDSAAYYFTQVLSVKPDDPEINNNVGAAYLNAKKYAQAINYFKKTISVNPNYISAYANLGKAYFYTQQYAAAADIFVRELTLNPRSAGEIPYLAMSYQKMGRMDDARKYEAIAKQYYPNFKLP